MPLPPIPAGVLAFAERGPDWAAYVERLPRLLRELAAEWSFQADGEPWHGHGSVVVPVRREGERAALKVAFPDQEGEHEALALQRWGGQGAVLLLRADPHRRALLLERLEPTDLTSLPVLEACEVVAGLYGRLHVPAPAQLGSLAAHVDRWTRGLDALARDAPIPHRFVQQAVSLGRSLVDDDATTGRMIHRDLHYQNVLASGRQPWLAIDPKPVNGDPHYEVAPMLWNRWEEAVATGDLRLALRRRFHTVVDAAGFEEERARDWVVVRMLHNALWELEDHPPGGAAAPDHHWLTTCITIAKAVQE